MVKEQLVTRTLYTTYATVLYVDLSSGTTTKHTVEIVGRYDKEADILDKVKEVYNPEGLRPVHVTHKKEEKHLYGMSEECFINNARVLPLRKVYYNKSTAATKKEEES